MMLHWPYLLPVIPALMLAWADFRSRRINISWLVVLGVTVLITSVQIFNGRTIVLYLLCNIIMVVLLLGSLAVWIRLEHKQPLQRLFRQWLGAGDVAMMLIVTPLFSPEEYLRFLLTACIAALAWWGLVRTQRRRTIPLAGFMAWVLVCYVSYKFIFEL